MMKEKKKLYSLSTLQLVTRLYRFNWPLNYMQRIQSRTRNGNGWKWYIIQNVSGFARVSVLLVIAILQIYDVLSHDLYAS